MGCSAGLPGHIQRSYDRESVKKSQQQKVQSIDQHQVPVMIAYTSSNENQFSPNPIPVYTATLIIRHSSRQLSSCPQISFHGGG